MGAMNARVILQSLRWFGCDTQVYFHFGPAQAYLYITTTRHGRQYLQFSLTKQMTTDTNAMTLQDQTLRR